MAYEFLELLFARYRSQIDVDGFMRRISSSVAHGFVEADDIQRIFHLLLGDQIIIYMIGDFENTSYIKVFIFLSKRPFKAYFVADRLIGCADFLESDLICCTASDFRSLMSLFL
jgi:hypothetical protein